MLESRRQRSRYDLDGHHLHRARVAVDDLAEQINDLNEPAYAPILESLRRLHGAVVDLGLPDKAAARPVTSVTVKRDAPVAAVASAFSNKLEDFLALNPSAASRTSPAIPIASRPSAQSPSAAAAIRSGVRLATPRRAPCSPSRFAIARLIPLDAPTTSALLPDTFTALLFLDHRGWADGSKVRPKARRRRR